MNFTKNPEEIDRDFHFKIPERVKNNHRRTAVPVFWGLLQQWMDKAHNEDGTKYISQQALADEMGCSRHTVQRRLEDFERVNLVSIKEGYNGPKGTKMECKWLDKAEQFKNEFYSAKAHEKEREYLKQTYSRQGEAVTGDEQLGVQCCKGSSCIEQETIQNPWHAGARTHEGQGQNQDKQKDSNQTALDEGGNNTGVPESVSENRKRWKLPQESRGYGEPIWKYLRYVRDNRWSSGDQNPIMEALAFYVDVKYHSKLNLEIRETVPTAIGKLFKDWDLKLENFEEVFDLLDELIEEIQTQVRQNVDKESAVYSAVNTFLKKNLSAFDGKDKWGQNSSDRSTTSNHGSHGNSSTSTTRKTGRDTGREARSEVNDDDHRRSVPAAGESHSQPGSEDGEEADVHRSKSTRSGGPEDSVSKTTSQSNSVALPSVAGKARIGDKVEVTTSSVCGVPTGANESIGSAITSGVPTFYSKPEKPFLRPIINPANFGPRDESVGRSDADLRSPDLLSSRNWMDESDERERLQVRVYCTLSPD